MRTFQRHPLLLIFSRLTRGEIVTNDGVPVTLCKYPDSTVDPETMSVRTRKDLGCQDQLTTPKRIDNDSLDPGRAPSSWWRRKEPRHRVSSPQRSLPIQIARARQSGLHSNLREQELDQFEVKREKKRSTNDTWQGFPGPRFCGHC